MKKISYKGYRFPPEIIQQSIWGTVKANKYRRFSASNPAEREGNS